MTFIIFNIINGFSNRLISIKKIQRSTDWKIFQEIPLHYIENYEILILNTNNKYLGFTFYK